MDLAQPQFVRRIIDVGIILQTGITMLIIAVVGMIGDVGCTIFAAHASQKMGADGRSGLFKKVQSGLDDVNTVMRENLAGVRVVKAFVRSEHEERRVGVANGALMNASVSATRLMAIVMPLFMLLINLAVVRCCGCGAVVRWS